MANLAVLRSIQEKLDGKMLADKLDTGVVVLTYPERALITQELIVLDMEIVAVSRVSQELQGMEECLGSPDAPVSSSNDDVPEPTGPDPAQGEEAMEIEAPEVGQNLEPLAGVEAVAEGGVEEPVAGPSQPAVEDDRIGETRMVGGEQKITHKGTNTGIRRGRCAACPVLFSLFCCPEIKAESGLARSVPFAVAPLL
ncbi:uncharacterized protein LOC135838050 [Planococcus citri]|uniref:uncharacterized protein LOC135838050 n=1 Tax=Planococcus citri TaxID=170843 RepID=UPI0031F9C80F